MKTLRYGDASFFDVLELVLTFIRIRLMQIHASSCIKVVKNVFTHEHPESATMLLKTGAILTYISLFMKYE